MTEKTGLFRRLEAFEKLMVAANAEASVAVAYLTEKERSEEFGPWNLGRGERAAPAKGGLPFR